MTTRDLTPEALDLADQLLKWLSCDHEKWRRKTLARKIQDFARSAARDALLKPNERVLDAATDAIVAGDRAQVQGSGLEASVEALRPVYRDFARAALCAAAMKLYP